MTLVLIALGAISIAGTARMSMRSAAEVSLREESLRCRWLLDSTRRVIDAHAPQLLAEHESGPLARRALSFKSQSSRVEVLVADESSKINLNRLMRIAPRRQRRRLFREYLGPSIKISEAVRGDRRTVGLEDLLSPAFDASSSTLPRRLRKATTRVTLWGDGRLNVQTVRDETLRSYLVPSIGSSAVDRLIAARADNPDSTVEQLIAAEENAETRRAVASLLRNDPGAISIWCEVAPADGVGRVAMSLDVMQSSVSAVARDW